jgi:hypothetical protein
LGNIYIMENPNLKKILGFNQLSFVLGDIQMTDNDALTAIDSFQELQTIGGGLRLRSLIALNSVETMSNLFAVEATIEVANTPISDLGFLSSLVRTGGLELYLAPQVSNLLGLSKLANAKLISVNTCQNFSSLNGLVSIEKLDKIDLGGLPNLKDFKGLERLTQLFSLKILGLPNLASLATGGPKIQIQDFLDISGTTKFKDLSEVDLAANFNWLSLSDSNLATLNGLETLESVEVLSFQNLAELKSLDGLQNVRSVSQMTFDRLNIRDLKPLARLEFAKTSLSIWDNSKLEDFSGLKGLIEVGTLSISRMPMKNLRGFPKGLVVKGGFDLRDNPNLLDLGGLNNISKVGGDIYIGGNPNLQSLQGMESLDIRGNAFIGYSNFISEPFDDLPKLTDVEALTKIVGIGGALRLRMAVCVDVELKDRISAKVSGLNVTSDQPLFGGDSPILISQPENCITN